MPENQTSYNKNSESSGEKLWKIGRNINALGAFGIGGVAMAILGPNVILRTECSTSGRV